MIGDSTLEKVEGLTCLMMYTNMKFWQTEKDRQGWKILIKLFLHPHSHHRSYHTILFTYLFLHFHKIFT